MAGFELLGHEKTAPAQRREPVVPPATVEPVAHLIDAKPALITIRPPASRKPQLVSSTSALPVGSAPELLTDLLKPAVGQRVEIEEVYRAFAVRCRAIGKRPVTPEQFVEPLQVFCRECRIESEQQRGRVHLVGVRLAAAQTLSA
jgi:hypothetical protein